MFGTVEKYPTGQIDTFAGLPKPAEALSQILTMDPNRFSRDELAQLAVDNPELLAQVVKEFGIEGQVYKGTEGLVGINLAKTIATNLSNELKGNTQELRSFVGLQNNTAEQ